MEVEGDGRESSDETGESVGESDESGWTESESEGEGDQLTGLDIYDSLVKSTPLLDFVLRPGSSTHPILQIVLVCVFGGLFAIIFYLFELEFVSLWQALVFGGVALLLLVVTLYVQCSLSGDVDFEQALRKIDEERKKRTQQKTSREEKKEQ